MKLIWLFAFASSDVVANETALPSEPQIPQRPEDAPTRSLYFDLTNVYIEPNEQLPECIGPFKEFRDIYTSILSDMTYSQRLLEACPTALLTNLTTSYSNYPEYCNNALIFTLKSSGSNQQEQFNSEEAKAFQTLMTRKLCLPAGRGFCIESTLYWQFFHPSTPMPHDILCNIQCASQTYHDFITSPLLFKTLLRSSLFSQFDSCGSLFQTSLQSNHPISAATRLLPFLKVNFHKL